MQESNKRFLHTKNTVCDPLSPYVGIIQIRFRVKASAYSQPACASTPFYLFFIIHILFLIARQNITDFSHMLMQIFFPRSKSSADMALRLIHIQHLSRLRRERRIDFAQTLCYVFMFGCYYLERFCCCQNRLLSIPFRLIPNLPADADKCLHFRLCPLRFSG